MQKLILLERCYAFCQCVWACVDLYIYVLLHDTLLYMYVKPGSLACIVHPEPLSGDKTNLFHIFYVKYLHLHMFAFTLSCG